MRSQSTAKGPSVSHIEISHRYQHIDILRVRYIACHTPIVLPFRTSRKRCTDISMEYASLSGEEIPCALEPHDLTYTLPSTPLLIRPVLQFILQLPTKISSFSRNNLHQLLWIPVGTTKPRSCILTSEHCSVANSLAAEHRATLFGASLCSATAA